MKVPQEPRCWFRLCSEENTPLFDGNSFVSHNEPKAGDVISINSRYFLFISYFNPYEAHPWCRVREIDKKGLAWQVTLESWARMIQEERDVIWQRELIAWHEWYELQFPDTTAQDAINDLKRALGGNGKFLDDAKFTSEGRIRSYERDRYGPEWLKHVKEHVNKEKRYHDKVRDYWTGEMRWLHKLENDVRAPRFSTRGRLPKQAIPPGLVRIRRGYLDESEIHMQPFERPVNEISVFRRSP